MQLLSLQKEEEQGVKGLSSLVAIQDRTRVQAATVLAMVSFMCLPGWPLVPSFGSNASLAVTLKVFSLDVINT